MEPTWGTQCSFKARTSSIVGASSGSNGRIDQAEPVSEGADIGSASHGLHRAEPPVSALELVAQHVLEHLAGGVARDRGHDLELLGELLGHQALSPEVVDHLG